MKSTDNEYLEYPTISRLSVQDKEEYYSSHIQTSNLLDRVEILEQYIESLKNLENKMVNVINGLEQRIRILEGTQNSDYLQPADDVLDHVEKPPISGLKNKLGEIVFFGKYEDAEIEWLVLDRNDEDGSILLISKYVLFTKKYHNERVECSWESCDIRKYLNNDFYYNCFSDEEKVMINKTFIAIEEKNETWGRSHTEDFVFLLSADEANRYFKSDGERKAAYLNETSYSNYWLRSPGSNMSKASYVFDSGSVLTYGYSVGIALGIRPVMWVHI